MLNPFPDLLTYGIFAPTLLRIVAAVAFGWLAYAYYKRRHEMAQMRFPFGAHGAWIPWVMIVVSALTTVGLFFGYYTQWAAILGALIGLKGAVWAKTYPRAFPLCRAEYILLLVICLSLLLSGAGGLAFDLPL